MSKKRRPEGLMRMYLQPRRASKALSQACFRSSMLPAQTEGAQSSEAHLLPWCVMLGSPSKITFPAARSKGCTAHSRYQRAPAHKWCFPGMPGMP